MSTLAKYLRLALIGFGVVTLVQSQGLPLERFTDCAASVVNGRESVTCSIPVASAVVAAATELASAPAASECQDGVVSVLAVIPPVRRECIGGKWIARAVADNASGIVTATFFPEEEINVPATGEPISIYRVDVKAEAAATKINAIDVFRAWPALVPMTKERATLELATKTERGIIRTVSRVVAMSASAGAVVAGVRSFVRSTNPALDTRNDAKWAMAGAAAAFLAQYAPQLAGQLAGAAPVYRVPEDTLSAGAFDLEAGEARTFHVVARGPMLSRPFTGVVR